MPSSPLGSKQNVKIFVLYLMQQVGYPMDFCTVNDIIMQTDYVAYLDFAEAFSHMEELSLIAAVGQNERGEPTYTVTEKGAMVVETLHSSIPRSILEESLACALRHLDFQKRGVKTSCRVEKSPYGGYDLHCRITERQQILLAITLHTDTAENAARMEAQFRASPENILRANIALFSGNVNYLFG